VFSDLDFCARGDSFEASHKPLPDARGFHEKAGVWQQQISKILDVRQ
jgi:hypothetical protein